jgi:hypothetical protein
VKISFNHPAAIGRGIFVRSLGVIVPPSVAIPEIRKALGMTAAELAAALQVSPRTLEGWEQGRAISTARLIDLRSFMEAHPKLKRL